MTDPEQVKEAQAPKKDDRSKVREGRQDPLSQVGPTSQPENHLAYPRRKESWT